MAFNRVDRGRLPQALADRLQNQIIEEALPPGTKLPTEISLMQQYDVSRTVVREAAAILASRGLVEVRPRRGMSVRQIDASVMIKSLVALLKANQVSPVQLLDVRLTLETAIAGTAATERTPDDISRLDDCLRRAEEVLTDQKESLRLDMLFHELLTEATHNPFYIVVTSPVAAILREMYEQSFSYLALQSNTLAEHQEILAAIVSQDADWAKVAVASHLRRVGNSIKTMIENESVGKTQGENPRH